MCYVCKKKFEIRCYSNRHRKKKIEINVRIKVPYKYFMHISIRLFSINFKNTNGTLHLLLLLCCKHLFFSTNFGGQQKKKNSLYKTL